MRQAKDPSHFGFFKSSASDVEHNTILFDSLLKEVYNEAVIKMQLEQRYWQRRLPVNFLL